MIAVFIVSVLYNIIYSYYYSKQMNNIYKHTLQRHLKTYSYSLLISDQH